METPEPPVPYRLSYSDAVKQRLRELSDTAIARGDGAAFTAALKEFQRRLALYPQFGDPLYDLKAEPGKSTTASSGRSPRATRSMRTGGW